MFNKRVIFVYLLSALFSCFADVKLPSLISDNMVIQQGKPFMLWGWAQEGEKIKVTFNEKDYHSVANNDGDWSIWLDSVGAGGPYDMVIEGSNQIIVSNILCGEVWLCSGQSNMDMPVYGWRERGHTILNSDDEIASADYPQIVMFNVEKKLSDVPLDDVVGCWSVCNPENVKDFSAAAYFYGRQLHKELDVPIGLIHSSYGASSVQAWMSKQMLLSDEELEEEIINPFSKLPSKQPCKLYNAMLRPVLNYQLKGVIWYQGEGNVSQAHKYRRLFEALINGWREVMNYRNCPFYYVQIAPYDYKKLSSPHLREAQMQCMDIDNVGMAVTLDIGNDEIIHPSNKQAVGKRLALWALAKTYKVEDIVYSGPIYKSMTVESNKIRLYFYYVNGGLVAKNENLTGFEIAGEDRVFLEAEAKIDNNTILVSSDNVIAPVAVRYAWSNTAKASLFNQARLPASLFRTDNWKKDEKKLRKG